MRPEETMNSKQRVLKALNHEEPDRVPIDISAWDEVMNDLIRYLGLWPEVINDSGPQQIGIDGAFVSSGLNEAQLAMLEKLNVDFRWAWAPYIGPEMKTFPVAIKYEELRSQTNYYLPNSLEWMPNTTIKESLWGTLRGGEGCGVSLTHPLENVTTVEEVEALPWDKWTNLDHYDYNAFAQECRDFSEAGYAVYGGPWAAIFSWMQEMMGAEKLFVDMIKRPKVVRAVAAKMGDFYYRQCDIMFQKARRDLDIFFSADDFGMQSGLQISIPMFLDFFKEQHEQMWRLAHHYGLKVQFHSCGAVRTLIPALLSMGLDSLDPVQVAAAGMVPRELKVEFGDQLTFHGGMDTQHVLPWSTPDQVRKAVAKLLETMAPGGGFIFSPSQHLTSEIPLENVIAMYESVYECGWYRSLGKKTFQFELRKAMKENAGTQARSR
jgi:uroporphyrinogen decarboxylase